MRKRGKSRSPERQRGIAIGVNKLKVVTLSITRELNPMPQVHRGYRDPSLPLGTSEKRSQERDRLNSRDFEPLAATYVLAHHHIIATHHVRLSFSKLGAVALIGPRGKLLLLGAYQPAQFILVFLTAARAVPRLRLLCSFLLQQTP